MSAQHTITVKDSAGVKRVDIECQNCKASMEVPDSPLGAAMVENWPKLHKCPKGAQR